MTIRHDLREPAEGRLGGIGRWLLVSLAVHALAFISWKGLQEWALRRPATLPEWVKSAVLPPPPVAPDPLKANRPKPPVEDAEEIPLAFIEVDPSQAVPTPPKDSALYSTANTLAGNPNPVVAEARQPRVEGRKPDTQRIMDVARPAETTPPPPPTPAPPTPVKPVETPAESKTVKPAEVAKQVQPARESKPRVDEVREGGLKAGETQIAKAVPNPAVPTPQAPRKAQAEEKPQDAQDEVAPPRKAIKRLAQAREQKGAIVGEKMQQDGGVKRFSVESSLDVRSSPFANYDKQLIYAVQQRWYALLEEHHYSLDRIGKVVIKFKLRSDGSVSDMTQVQSQVGDLWSLLCESAVMSQAPYARWPEGMRRIVGKDSRDITFTFHYDNN